MVIWVKRLSWVWRGVIALAVVAMVLVGAFVAVQYATAASVGDVQPSEDAFVASSEVVVSLALPGASPSAEDVEFLVDAEPVPAEALEIAPGSVKATVRLRDGAHWARVTVTSNNVFSRELVRSWEFTVDTTPPSVEVAGSGGVEALAQPDAELQVTFREPVSAVLAIDQVETPLDVQGNAAVAPVRVGEGHHVFAVTATDKAGNVGTGTWEAWADFTKPRVGLTFSPDEPWKQTSGRFVFEANDNQAEGLVAEGAVDGRPVDVNIGKETGENGVRRYSVDTGILREGVHEVTFTVTDRGGHVNTRTEKFLVDTTERFGLRGLGPGAQGRDVRDLQRALQRKGYLEGDPTSLYDDATAAAVVAFKTERGLPDTPELDKEALTRLVGFIRIDISERKLYHYEDGKLVKTYGVAVGQPRYPTPKGNWVIIEKEYHPTWNPPPSPWAEGLEPVPPGPGNPLGTRWMGTSAPAIGIHGTYADGSIGTAASHGCIRMHIWDVEELFELVYVGTPVEIVP